MSLLTYFSHHGGRMRSLSDIDATLRDRVDAEHRQPARQTRQLVGCASVRTPDCFIKSTPVGANPGNARKTGPASSCGSSTIRTRSERRL